MHAFPHKINQSSYVAGSDYTGTMEQFTLQGGGFEIVPIDIPILNDDMPEAPMAFATVITPTSPLPARIQLNPNSGLVVIEDDDEFPNPSLTIVPPLPSQTRESDPYSIPS